MTQQTDAISTTTEQHLVRLLRAILDPKGHGLGYVSEADRAHYQLLSVPFIVEIIKKRSEKLKESTGIDFAALLTPSSKDDFISSVGFAINGLYECSNKWERHVVDDFISEARDLIYYELSLNSDSEPSDDSDDSESSSEDYEDDSTNNQDTAEGG